MFSIQFLYNFISFSFMQLFVFVSIYAYNFMVITTCICRSSTLIIHKAGKIETLKVAHPMDSSKCYSLNFHCVVQTCITSKRNSFFTPVCVQIQNSGHFWEPLRPILQRVQIKFIFSDNVRIHYYCLSCKVKKSKATAKFS